MSSSSDSDEIEIDGFPPESASTARFTSMKSTTEAGQTQRFYLPINSWSVDVPPEDLIKGCLKVLKEPTTISEEEKRLLLEQLEGHLMNKHEIQNSDSLWNSKSISTFPKSPLRRPELSKSNSIKVNIEIPASSSNQNNIKYSIDQPIYDQERLCWKTGMDFILQNTNPPIFESEKEVYRENKSTQTEFEFQSIRDSFVLLQKPICHDSRSRSEEKLIYPEIINLDSLTERLSTDKEFSFLETFEETLKDFNSAGQFPMFKTSFRRYKDVIQKSLQKHIQDIRRLKAECESVMTLSYDKLTESQFKRHAQNQLILIDVEQEINFLNADINRKDFNLEKMTKFRFGNQDCKQLEDEIKQTRFANSLRLISQMITNLKSQVTGLTAELKNPVEQKSVVNSIIL